MKKLRTKQAYEAFGILRGFALLICLLTCVSNVFGQNEDWLSGSSYRRAITINSSDFDNDVSDLLYHFTITTSDLQYVDECGFVKQENGYDIRFTDSENPPNVLDHEVISYDNSTGQYRGWVRVANVSAATNQVIYMYYGDRTAASDPSSTNTFPASDLLGVWHFDNTDTYADATTNANDLTPNGPTIVSDNCITDECILLNEDEQDYISINDADFDFGSGSFTLEGWFNIQPKFGADPAEFVQIFEESSQHAEEALNTTDYQTNGDVIQLGRNLTQWNDFTKVGIQFERVGIPFNNEITDAYIEFVAQEDGIGFAKFEIDAETIDNPSAYSMANPPTSRALTGSPVEWLPTSWVAGQTYRTSNLASLIQPLVSADWDNQGLSFIIGGDDSFGSREADNDGIRLVVEYENPDPGVATEYQLAVSSINDDAEEDDNGDVILNTPLTFRSSANDWVGVRFDNVAIPNNAIIEDVRVRFKANSDATSATTINIYLEESFNSTAFQVSTFNLSERLSSEDQSFEVWNPPSWSAGDQGTNTETGNLAPLFTDFFSDLSWSSGNALTLLFEPVSGGRTAISRNTNAEEGPQLIIRYYILENETQTIVSRHSRNGVQGGGFSTWVDRAGKLNFGIDNDSDETIDGEWTPDVVVTTLDNVDDSQWYHFGAVKEDDKLTLYLNGEPQDIRSETHETIINLIESSQDDAEEDLGDNSVTLDGMDGLALQWGTDGGDDQRIIGLRFSGVQLPPDATIISSFIQIVSSTNDNNGTETCEVDIKLFPGNVGEFQPNVGYLSGLYDNPLASSPVRWTIPPFSTDDPADEVIATAFNSPDLSTIIQNAATTANGWVQGGSMAFLIQGVSETGQRETRAFDSPTSGQGGAATLIIEYKESGNNYGSISLAGTTPMYLGDDPDFLLDETENMQGRLDEFRVHNSALSPDKIKAQYQTLAEPAAFSTIASSRDEVTWTGGGLAGEGNWTDGDNWNTGIPPWDDMDFVYTSALPALELDAPLVAGNVRAAEGVILDLNGEELDVDCSCEVSTIAGGTLHITSEDVPIRAPGIATEVQVQNLEFGANTSAILQADLSITGTGSDPGLTFGGSGTLDANGNTITFADNYSYASPTYSNTDNAIILGSDGTLIINGVRAAETAVFQVSHTETLSVEFDNLTSFARVELTNNTGVDAQYSVALHNEVYSDGTVNEDAGGTRLDEDLVETTWFITADGMPDADMTLYWHEENALSLQAQSAQINHYNSGGSTWELMGDAESMVDHGEGILSASAAGITSFSPFGISSSETVLPVELLSFSAGTLEAAIRIEWETATELNNDHFILEKSLDGQHFEMLEIVQGSGTTSEKSEYHALDRNPVTGLQYYRLWQIDFDGTTEELGTQVVDFQNPIALDMDVYPNPANAEVNVMNLHSGTYRLEIVGLDGKVVRSEEIQLGNGRGKSSLDLGDLPAGVFMLRLSDGKQVYSRKLIKN